jgi:replicative DNA helicase
MAPLLSGALERIEELYNTGGDITGLTTGFIDLDRMTSGLQSSDLVIVAGRPSMGKTPFAMNLVENAALASDRPIMVFSMEMPAEQLVIRMLSSLGRIDQSRVRTGKLEQDDWPKLSSATEKLKDTQIFIDDTPALTPTELRSRVRRLVREQGDLGMIMVDYLQLMRVAGSSEGRTAEISEISRSLKALAKEFKVPVVALSQLNRALEQRPNKRPVNSDLRESGAIEQDADVIMFIYRDEVYNEDSPDQGVAEIIIGKQRNGPIGTCRLSFQGQFTRFENLARSDYENYGV